MQLSAVFPRQDRLVQPRVVRPTVAQKGMSALVRGYVAMATEGEEDAAHGARWRGCLPLAVDNADDLWCCGAETWDP